MGLQFICYFTTFVIYKQYAWYVDIKHACILKHYNYPMLCSRALRQIEQLLNKLSMHLEVPGSNWNFFPSQPQCDSCMEQLKFNFGVRLVPVIDWLQVEWWIVGISQHMHQLAIKAWTIEFLKPSIPAAIISYIQNIDTNLKLWK